MTQQTRVPQRTSIPSTPSISLVLPAYNEAAVIEQAIDEAVVALKTVTDDCEIIVVDDGSSDDTVELVLRCAERYPPVRLVRHGTNRGYGAALRNGFAAATKALVCFTDADCQFDLHELDRLVLLAKSYDIVCGYRIDRKDSPVRCLYSRGYNFLVRMMLGIDVRDVDCAFKLFHRRVLRNLEIRTDGFLVNSELLTQAKRKGYRVVEVGVSHRPRAGGASTVSIHHIPVVLASLLRFWWNQVQFPANTAPVADDRRASPRGVSWPSIALLLIAGIVLLTNLNYPLIDRDETRYAEIPREMIATGNWLLPQLNFEPYYDKPPLLYWLCALSYRLFGVHEWTARLAPVLAAWVTLGARLWFGTRWFGRRVGFWSGVVLSLTGGFVFCSRYLLIDGLFTCLMTLSWMTGFEAIRRRQLHRGWWLASGVFGGLAFLAKGPIAWVLWLPPVLGYAWLTTVDAKPRLHHFALWAIAGLFVSAPWFILVAMEDPRFITEFFVTHNVQRFAGTFHTKPWWFFVPVILVGGHPWSSLSWPLGRFLFTRNPPRSLHRPHTMGFLALWSLWCFAFFSLSKCKLPTYVLPMAPAVAMIVGIYLVRLLEQPSGRADRLGGFWSPRLATTITASATAGLFIFFFTTGSSPVSPGMIVLAILWMSPMLLAMVLCYRVKTPAKAWITSAVTAGLMSLAVLHQLLPAYGRNQSLLGGNPALRTQVAGAGQIVTIRHEFSEVPFYLNRSDVKHWTNVEAEQLSASLDRGRRFLVFVHASADLENIRTCLPRTTRLNVLSECRTGKVVSVEQAPQRLAEAVTEVTVARKR